jgi:hypothetical protein
MSSPLTPASLVAPDASSANLFQAHLSALYSLSPQNNHVFGSPLGPIYQEGRAAYLPRFAFFGPHASDDSWRIAFLAAFDQRDLRGAHALLHLVERLARNSEEGHGLNLTFFPLVDAGGFFLGAPRRALEQANWARSSAPEIRLLEKDARLHGYHGFVRVETAPTRDEFITVRVRESVNVVSSRDDLISSAETIPFPVRFERIRGTAVAEGPLTIADDLPFRPFELTLRIPEAWPDDRYYEAVGAILVRFIVRYRANQAYGQHL